MALRRFASIWQNPDILVNVTEDPVAETRTGPGTRNRERYPDPHVRNGVRKSLVKKPVLETASEISCRKTGLEKKLSEIGSRKQPPKIAV